MANMEGPFEDAEIERFFASHTYEPEAFLVDRVVTLDHEAGRIEAVLDTTRALPFSALQRVSQEHPAHVSAGDLLMITGCLGSLAAWFFHDCRGDEGWAGFGSRIHRADFRGLAKLGPPLDLHFTETKLRTGPRRVVMRGEFEFEQEGRVVYRGDQTAIFVRQYF